jgi:hypothetical protein
MPCYRRRSCSIASEARIFGRCDRREADEFVDPLRIRIMLAALAFAAIVAVKMLPVLFDILLGFVPGILTLSFVLWVIRAVVRLAAVRGSV